MMPKVFALVIQIGCSLLRADIIAVNSTHEMMKIDSL